MNINKGDIIQLKWDALESIEGQEIIQEKHPFVVLRNNNENEIVICVISSVNKVNKKFPHNVSINDWEDANLTKHCHAKTDKISIVTIDDIYKKIGYLSPNDYIRVMSNYNKCPSSDYIIIEMMRR